MWGRFLQMLLLLYLYGAEEGCGCNATSCSGSSLSCNVWFINGPIVEYRFDYGDNRYSIGLHDGYILYGM